MTVKQRLTDYIKFKGLTKSEFCRTIEVSSAYITSIVTSIQPDKIQRITLNYPDLNIGWLLTGMGSMLINSPSPTSLIQLEKVSNIVKDTPQTPEGQPTKEQIYSNVYKEMIVEKDKLISSLNQEIGMLRERVVNFQKELSQTKSSGGLSRDTDRVLDTPPVSRVPELPAQTTPRHDELKGAHAVTHKGD